MQNKDEKKYKLSVYLIKNSFLEDTEIIPKTKELNPYEIQDKKGHLGTLYIKTDFASVPKWAEFFSGIFAPQDIGLFTKSARAVLMAKVKKRKFCLTFGHAHYLINPLAIERNFGLKVALNIGGQTSLRAVDKTSLDVVEIQSKEHSSKEVGIATFDFDSETDILKSITAKNEEGTTIVSGRDSVSIGAAVTLKTLREFLEDLLKNYESKEYKKKFPLVDNVSEIRDKAIIEKLNEQLFEKVAMLDPAVWLAIPEIVIWEEISGFAYKSRANPVVSPDIHLKAWSKEIVKGTTIDFEQLKTKKIYLYDVNYQLYKTWPVYHCLNAEIDFNGRKYILNDGCWYEIDTDFVSIVNKFFSGIEESSVELPPYETRKEPEYNEFVAHTYPNKFFLMDRKTIGIGGGRSSVEFCDLFSKDKKLVHIKKYGGSSVLSHLFQQGVVSGESFLSDLHFRNEVNQKLDAAYKLDEVGARPNPSDYEICYAIMSDIPGELHIPFFSKVVMKNAVNRLQTYGYKVTKKKINIY